MANFSKQKAPASKTEDWQPFATFIVEYQGDTPSSRQYRTNVHLLENGQSAEWKGIEGKSAMDWIIKQVAVLVQGHIPTQQTTAQSKLIDLPQRLVSKKITVTDNQGNTAIYKKGENFIGHVYHNAKLSIILSVDIKGGTYKDLENYWRTDFFAVRLSDGKTYNLGESSPEFAKENAHSLKVTLSNFSLDAGVYTLRAVTVHNHKKPALEYFEAQLLVVT